MSRLIVKNLPKSISEQSLRKLFCQKGRVTDIQLKYTKDGKFRQFAFIGFKTTEEAADALEYFNNSFIHTHKISVEICSQLGAEDKPKSWSKYSSDSTAYKLKQEKNKKSDINKEILENIAEETNKNNNTKIKEILEEHKNDPLFGEFMELHQKNNANWIPDETNKINESVEGEGEEERKTSDEDEEEEEEEERVENEANKKISDMEYFKLKTINNFEKQETNENEETEITNTKKEKATKKYFTIKVRGLTMKTKKKDLKEFFNPLKPKSFRFPQKMKGFAYVCFKTEKEMKQAIAKNKSFLAGKKVLITVEDESKKNKDNSEKEKDSSKWKNQEENLKNEETITESGRIFLRNLAYSCTEEDIEKLFTSFGPLTEVSMPIDKFTRQSKGFAMVTFLMPEHAVNAYVKLDGTIFQGRMLHLLPGKVKHTVDELMEKDGLSYNSWKKLKEKAQSGSSHNWNSLFLGQNAVADVMAQNYYMSKEMLLDAKTKESLAVRLALGETQIVTLTREFLEENGVKLDAFNQPPKQRAKNIILVKNLPANTKQEEILDIFEKFGHLGRVLLPPSGVTAIVEFLEPYEARNAFTKLAYSKFKHSPLYLEWAPAETFETSFDKNKQRKEKKEEEKQEVKDEDNENKESEKVDESSEEEDEPPEPDTTLFIKGLNFLTKEETIKEHFKSCGPIHYVSIAKKKDVKNPGQFLSLGYAFIQFKHTESANKALKALQHSKIDDFSIELKRSNRALINEVPSNRKATKRTKQNGTKILIRNIPFQATKEELNELFSPFGGIKSLRLPKKMAGTGSHRGFCFVDYFTKGDAKIAFKNLSQSTHLYGRRLVLEWAQEEESILEIRKRTAKYFKDVSSSKNFKKGVFDMEDNAVEKEETF